MYNKDKLTNQLLHLLKDLKQCYISLIAAGEDPMNDQHLVNKTLLRVGDLIDCLKFDCEIERFEK